MKAAVAKKIRKLESEALEMLIDLRRELHFELLELSFKQHGAFLNYLDDTPEAEALQLRFRETSESIHWLQISLESDCGTRGDLTGDYSYLDD